MSDSVLARLTMEWDRFWCAPASRQTLGLVRIFFGFVFFLRMTGATGLYRFDTITMRFPKRSVFPIRDMFDSWSMPYSLLEWLPIPSEFWWGRIEEALLLLSVLLTVGLFTRIVAPVLAGLFTYVFFLSQMHFYHHMLLYGIVFWILAFCRCGQHYSLDATRRDPRARDALGSMLPLRLIQVLVCAIYFFTFLWKSNSGWTTGSIMEIFEETGSLKGPFVDWSQSFLPHQVLSVGTLIIEGALPVCLLWPVTRRLAIFAGVCLHIGIDATMNVNSYSYQMFALYIAFLTPAASATVVLFDGSCGLCQRGRRVMSFFDWLRRLRWVDFHSEEGRAVLPGKAPEDLSREMHLITPGGETRVGFAAWREILASCPMSFLPGMLLFIPPLPWIGRHVYRWGADHRGRHVCPVERPTSSETAEPRPIVANSETKMAARLRTVTALALLGLTVALGATFHRRNSPSPPVTAALPAIFAPSRLEAYTARASAYLQRQLQPSGQFVYRINTDPTVSVKAKYNMLRHAGAIYSLAMVRGETAHLELDRALVRATEFLMESSCAPVGDSETMKAIWSRPEIGGFKGPVQAKLGGTGLGLVALLSVEKIAPGTTPIKDLRSLGRFLLMMQHPEGNFTSKFIPSEGGRQDDWESLYYPGEASLGLVMLYERDRDPQWLDCAGRAMEYLARTRAGQTRLPADHWALLATARLLPHVNSARRSRLIEHAIGLCESILRERFSGAGDRLRHGGFMADGRTTPTATRLEGLLAALTFLPDGPTRLRERIAEAVHPGIDYLMRSQIKTGRHAGGVPRAIAQLPDDHPNFSRSFNIRAGEVRIDYVQHALSAMVQYRDLLPKGRSTRQYGQPGK